MNTDEQLIKKAYFENYTADSTSHPIKALGELYLEENKKEFSDFSYIRFAQGEVYFHHKDFETAIFKWENIDNELGPWSKKNMADAYMELGLFETAEGIYLSIASDSSTLRIETDLKLLSIYMEQGKIEKAIEVVNAAVTLNPDYPNVTEIARSFFEEHGEWDHAVRLACNEAVRTELDHWFTTLKTYIDGGYTANHLPAYFNEVLTALYPIDRQKFERLAASLWKSYKDSSKYQDWIKNFNTIFLNMNTSRRDSWQELPNLYQESYFELINGTRLIKAILPIIPDHLSNWLKIANSETSLFASSSVMAWSEMFPMSLSSEVVREAEELILNAQYYSAAREDSLQLFYTVSKWAEENGIEPGNVVKWNVDELANQQSHCLILAGLTNSGKSDFINQVLREDLMTEPTSSIVALKYGKETEVCEITEEEKHEIASLEEFQEAIGVRRQNHKRQTVIDFKMPNKILKENELRILDTPSINQNNVDHHPLNYYVHFADSLLFILDAANPLTDREKEILKQVSIQAPNLPVHFVLNKIESLSSDEEMNQVYDKTLKRIRAFFPGAELMPFSLTDQTDRYVDEFSQLIRAKVTRKKSSKERIAKLQHFVGRSIHYLIDKRIEKENNLVESVRWNEEMVTKLNGASNQVGDLEDEKKQSIKTAYKKMKDEIKAEMLAEIPKILRGSSELISEDSDFGKIHIKLNQEMNDRVQNYLENTLLKKFYTSLQEWIGFSKDEFVQAQYTLDEMSAGFNSLYGEEKINQECDFKVLDDWRRDADRMTSGIQLEEFNFLLRFTPGHFMLKSAGKLLSALSQNKSILYNKYKSYLENEDYQESAQIIADKFFKQFEMFEKSIERDVNLFFREPLHVLDKAVEEAQHQIETSKNELEKMRVKPELYRDPLNLFEVRLRQYEWMAAAGKSEN